MASTQVDPHDKMRSRDVSKVALGEQAPRPEHELGSVAETPDIEPSALPENILEVGTAPADFRFPTTNQTRHCYTRFIEYHRCIRAKGEGAPECQKFARYYRSLCPSEWITSWNEQLDNGTFPGPL